MKSFQSLTWLLHRNLKGRVCISNCCIVVWKCFFAVGLKNESGRPCFLQLLLCKIILSAFVSRYTWDQFHQPNFFSPQIQLRKRLRWNHLRSWGLRSRVSQCKAPWLLMRYITLVIGKFYHKCKAPLVRLLSKASVSLLHSATHRRSGVIAFNIHRRHHERIVGGRLIYTTERPDFYNWVSGSIPLLPTSLSICIAHSRGWYPQKFFSGRQCCCLQKRWPRTHMVKAVR